MLVIYHQYLTYSRNIKRNTTSHNQPLINQIKNGNAVVVTYVSLSPYTELGASSFTITTTDLQTLCYGSHGVPEESSPVDSHHAKLCGIWHNYLSTIPCNKI